MVYLVPVFMTLYLKTLELKHEASDEANKRYNQVTNLEFGSSRSTHASPNDPDSKIVDDEVFVWERYAAHFL
jgi:hypothetical protein